MLGAITTEAKTSSVSVPPATHELSDIGKRDWMTGIEIINACMDTYKNTATCVLFIPSTQLIA